MLKSNGLHRPENLPVKFGFSPKSTSTNIAKKLPLQRCFKPLLIALFNFLHKRPTFAFTSESGYTLAFRRRIAHNGSHGETGGISDGGGITTLGPFRTFTNIPGPGIRTAYFAAFGSWPGVLSKNAESLRNSDALMRVAVPRRRGPAGLRDPIAVPLTALIGFTVLADRDYSVRKKAHFVFMRRAVLPALPAPSAALLYALMH